MIVPTRRAPARHDGAQMIRIRRGVVLRVLDERPGIVELAVDVDGDAEPALAYPAIVGPVGPGDTVLLNTTAVALGLGTGGWHFVMGAEGAGSGEVPPGGHLMKLRYTPEQVAVHGVEELDGPHGAAMAQAGSLEHTPVVWIALHSMLGPVVAGAVAAGARSVAYVMTDGAALPAPFSRLARRLRDRGLLGDVVSCGQAFGGDLEAVNAFSGLLAARHVSRADVIVIGDGPGNTGTRTRWGASNVWSAMSINGAAILDGEPIAALRVSFADPRPQHRGVSHHSLTVLERVALSSIHVAVPALDDDVQRRTVWDALRDARIEERHRIVEANGRPALDLLDERGIEQRSMGRGPADDPAFFLAAGAAGILAGRMAEGNRTWASAADGPTGQGEGPSSGP